MDGQYIAFVKSYFVSDAGNNGGRMSYVPVLETRHSLFDHVEYSDTVTGFEKYRKEFLWYKDPNGVRGYEIYPYVMFPTNGNDRIFIASGTHDDDQDDVEGGNRPWVGSGQLNANISSGAVSVGVVMESDEPVFIPGGKVVFHNRFMFSQTVDDGTVVNRPKVRVSDSVQYDDASSKWKKINPTTNRTYPYGQYIGGGRVMTENTGWVRSFFTLEEKKTIESIGTGTGGDSQPVLTDLSGISNGLVTFDGYVPTVTSVCGGIEREVYVGSDGVCSGHCSAGQINVSTGQWVVDIAWLTPPDNTADIQATYYDKNYTYSGNVATIEIVAGEIQDSFLAENTYICACLPKTTVLEPLYDSFNLVSSGGTYDLDTYPLQLFNIGTARDYLVGTFTSSTAYTLTSQNFGTTWNFNSGSNASPTNPKTGTSFFTIPAGLFSGTIVAGDQFTFETYPCSIPIWWKEIGDAGLSTTEDNMTSLGVFGQ